MVDGLTRGYIEPIKDRVYIKDIETGANTLLKSGIIVPGDNMNNRGVRPRWATVYKVGPLVTGLSPGDRILISHARWTKSFWVLDNETDEPIELRAAEYPEGILLAMINDTDVEQPVDPVVNGFKEVKL